MNPNQKINYDRILKKMIDHWKKEKIRPSILIHSCCAPCSTYTLEYLAQFAEITIYFANSNIHPKKEYEKRKLVQEKFIQDFNQTTNYTVQFLSAEYRPKEFFRQTKGFENEPEGGKRCTVCFQMRLDETAQKAAALGFDYFGSALTLSPKKKCSAYQRAWDGNSTKIFYILFAFGFQKKIMVINAPLSSAKIITYIGNAIVVVYLRPFSRGFILKKANSVIK